MLSGKKLLLGITGSIAAFKIPAFVRLLIREGAEVKIIMTRSAADFVSPLTLSTLSKNPVLTDLAEENNWANHVMLGRWADLFLIAPLSCNSLAKMAQGICDNLLNAVYLSSTCPVAVAPAMDEDMWKHPSTRLNIQKIQSYGNRILPVNHGELASGLVGEGRMAEPEEMLQWISQFFETENKLQGKTVLISAGPTYEPIDPVRFIGNRSSGKMGLALTQACLDQGAKVVLIAGPVTEKLFQHPNLEIHQIETAVEMYEACMAHFPSANIAIMAAAVADYTPVTVAQQKIKKSDADLSVSLQPTQDILKTLGQQKKAHQILVGFALETNNESENAKKKLMDKNADYIVLNSMQDAGAGFAQETNKITIFERNGTAESFDLKSKTEVAKDIIHTILKHKHV